MDDEELKDMIEDEEPQFDSLKNVLYKRYDRVCKEEEEEPNKRRRTSYPRESV